MAPTYTIHGAGFFTVIMIDIDAPEPTNATLSPYLHHIVANLNEKHDANRPTNVTSYVGVAPPKGTFRLQFAYLLGVIVGLYQASIGTLRS